MELLSEHRRDNPAAVQKASPSDITDFRTFQPTGPSAVQPIEWRSQGLALTQKVRRVNRNGQATTDQRLFPSSVVVV